jgi:hypothetical protein
MDLDAGLAPPLARSAGLGMVAARLPAILNQYKEVFKSAKKKFA